MAADPHAPSTTPYRHDDVPSIARLDKLFKRYQRGIIPPVEWLDAHTLPLIEKTYENHVDTSADLLLIVDLPAYELPVVYGEPELPIVPSHTSSTSASVSADAEPNVAAGIRPAWLRPSLFTHSDPEGMCENLVESKHRRLVRGQRSATLDRERKPTASVRDTLRSILLYPPTRVLTTEEMDLVWAFRFYLTRDPAALTKFVKSVVWTDAQEASQATEELLPIWAEPQIADTLELLGPSFLHLQVRAYAVRQLHRASNEQLALYLLQLVQALKFEEYSWHAASETQRAAVLQQQQQEQEHAIQDSAIETRRRPPMPSSEPSVRLVDLLCSRSTQSTALGTKFYWYVAVERCDSQYGELFARVEQQLHAALEAHNAPLLTMLERQRHFVQMLATKNAELRVSRDTRPKKIEKLRALLADRKAGLRTLDPPLSLPLDPDVCITGVAVENSTVFKSNLFPWRLEFRVDDDISTYTVIVKNGDDLRQDQLVLQLFALMDSLLRDEHLDVCITPYHVLATSPHDGLVQFIPSMSVAEAVAKHGDLLGYLRSKHPDYRNATTFDVLPQVLDTFVRSCGTFKGGLAPWSVFTLQLATVLLRTYWVSAIGTSTISCSLPMDISSTWTSATFLVAIRNPFHHLSRYARKWSMLWVVLLPCITCVSRNYVT